MGRKRGKDQILCRILEACAGGGASKTQIVYYSGLNLHTVVPYIDLITANDLVVKAEGTSPRYKITARGIKALGCFQELEVLIPDLRVLAEKEVTP